MHPAGAAAAQHHADDAADRAEPLGERGEIGHRPTLVRRPWRVAVPRIATRRVGNDDSPCRERRLAVSKMTTRRQTRSLRPTTPTNMPSLTTGNSRSPRSAIRSRAAPTVASRSTVIGALRHHLTDRAARALRVERVAQHVGLAHQPDQPPVPLHHRQRGVPVLEHQLDGPGQGGAAPDGDHVVGHHVGDGRVVGGTRPGPARAGHVQQGLVAVGRGGTGSGSGRRGSPAAAAGPSG